MDKIYTIGRESDETLAKGQGAAVQVGDSKKFVESQPKFSGYEIVEKQYIQSSIEPKFLEDRPDLLDVLSFIQPNDIPCYWNMERLSRDSFVRSEFIQRLIHKKGVKRIIISNKEYDLTNQSDLMVMGIYSNVTHKQTQEDLRRKIEGKRLNIEKGYYPGGSVAPGWKLVKTQDERNKIYVIDEDGPKGIKFYHRIVNMFFDHYKSANYIAMTFNKEKIPTSGRFDKCQYPRFKNKGRFWTGASIIKILKNPSYMGKNKDGKSVRPALISEEKWHKIQKEITKRSKNGGSTKKELLLRSFLICERCGHKLSVNRDKYICSYRNLENVYKPYLKKCDLPPISISKLDEVIWNRVSMTLISDEKLKKALLAKTEQLDVPALRNKISELQAGLKRFERAKSDLLSFLSSGHWTKDEVMENVCNINADMAQANSEIALLKDKLNGEAELRQLLHNLRTVTNQLRANLHWYKFKQKRMLLLKVLKRVVIDYSGAYKARGTNRGKLDPDGLTLNIELKIKVTELSNFLEITLKPEDTSNQMVANLSYSQAHHRSFYISQNRQQETYTSKAFLVDLCHQGG